MFWVLRKRSRLLCTICVFGVLAGAAILHAQRRIELYLLAFDNEGYPVVDLKATELQFKEGETAGNVVSIERYRWPVKVTILVDNGTGGVSGTGGAGRPTSDASVYDNINQYRNGLKKFVEALPSDVAVSILTTAPAPRHLVKNSTDPVQIRKAVDLVAPDHESVGRFTDSLTEYSERLNVEFKGLTKEQRPPYLPVLVSIGSTGLDGSRVEIERVSKMIDSLRNFGVWTNFMMVSPSSMSANPENEGGTVLIAKAVQDATRGSYTPIASSATTRLTTLLPELARKIAIRHVKQTLQYRVVLERPETATGPLGNTQMSVSRAGVNYVMSLDGSYP